VVWLRQTKQNLGQLLLRPALSFAGGLAIGLPELKLRFNYGVVNTVIKAKL